MTISKYRGLKRKTTTTTKKKKTTCVKRESLCESELQDDFIMGDFCRFPGYLEMNQNFKITLAGKCYIIYYIA